MTFFFPRSFLPLRRPVWDRFSSFLSPAYSGNLIKKGRGFGPVKPWQPVIEITRCQFQLPQSGRKISRISSILKLNRTAHLVYPGGLFLCAGRSAAFNFFEYETKLY